MPKSNLLNRKRRQWQRRFTSTEVLEHRLLLTVPQYSEVTGAENPFWGIDTEIRQAAPAFVDLDADGDFDLAVGHLGGRFRLLENVGSPTDPEFVERILSENPLTGLHLDEVDSTPAFGDLDGDGDADLVSRGSPGTAFFENTGSAADAAFARRRGTENPLDGVDSAGHLVTLGDIDGDGDFDLIGGDRRGFLGFAENTGTPSMASFVGQHGDANPFVGIDVGEYAAPVAGDIDGDGDVDVIVGNAEGVMTLVENTGDGFVSSSGGAFSEVLVTEYSRPALADLDGDGDLDLAVGEYSGSDMKLRYFENTGTVTNPSFASRTGEDNPFLGHGVRGYLTPVLVDLDGDQDLDIVTTSFEGGLLYFENSGSNTSPVISAPSRDPFVGLDAGERIAPTFGDLDGDGDLDMLAGTSDGTLSFLENTGTAQDPRFLLRSGMGNPLNGFDVGNLSVPALGDVDGDLDLDLVVGHVRGIQFFENTGSEQAPEFTLRAEAASPVGELDTGTVVRPTFVDVDRDGDTDLVFGSNQTSGDRHNLRLVENTGTALEPEFTPRLGTDNAFPQSAIGSDVLHPTFGDVDNDGDVDLVAATPDADGSRMRIRFFEASLLTDSVELPAGGGTYELFVDGGDLVLQRQGAEELFRESMVGGLTIDGSADDDVLIVDWSSGNPIPGGGVIFNAGDGTGDALQLAGGTASLVTHTFSTGTDGTVDVDGSVITYTGVEPLTDLLASTSRTFHLTNSDETLTIGDDSTPDDGVLQLGGSAHNGGVIVDGPSGTLQVNGRAGADTITLAALDSLFSASIQIDGGADNDTIDTSAISSAVVIAGGSGNDQITTGAGADQLDGGDGNDVVSAGDGNNRVFGGGGDDTLTSGSGDDTLNGQGGNDVLQGNSGNDALIGGAGRDRLEGGDGEDFLKGSSGADAMFGGDGDDRLLGGSQNDMINGQAGDDRIFGQGGNDTLWGGSGRDLLDASGGGGFDKLFGQSGRDTLTGGRSADTINGGGGIDRLVEITDHSFVLSDDQLMETTPGATRTDTLVSIERVRLSGNGGDNSLDASAFTRPVTLLGGGGDDTLVSGSGGSFVNGGNGHDLLRGGDGRDVLRGDDGNDSLAGGGANDTLLGGDDHDVLVGQSGDDVVNGKSGRDTLLGGDGHDTLFGGGGDDTLLGESGDDVLRGNSLNDTGTGGGNGEAPTAGDDVQTEVIDNEFTFTAEWLNAA